MAFEDSLSIEYQPYPVGPSTPPAEQLPPVTSPKEDLANWAAAIQQEKALANTVSANKDYSSGGVQLPSTTVQAQTERTVVSPPANMFDLTASGRGGGDVAIFGGGSGGTFVPVYVCVNGQVALKNVLMK